MTRGKHVFFRQAGTVSQQRGQQKMKRGTFVGHHERTGASLFITPEGVERGVGIHRLPEDQRHDLEFLKKCKGMPWAMKVVNRTPAVSFAGGGDPAAPPLIVAPVAAPAVGRVMYVLRGDVQKYGGTDGCPGCLDVFQDRPATHRHTDECRRRIAELLQRDREANPEVEMRLKKLEDRAKDKRESAMGPTREAEAPVEEGKAKTSMSSGSSTERQRSPKRRGEESTEMSVP